MTEPHLMDLMDPIQDLAQARQLVRWMAHGVTPSASHAQAGAKAIEAAMHDTGVDLHEARRLIASIAMGVAPSQDKCLAACGQLEAAIEAMRELDAGGSRPGRERMR